MEDKESRAQSSTAFRVQGSGFWDQMGDRGDSKGKHQPAGETATTTETATGGTGETARGDNEHQGRQKPA